MRWLAVLAVMAAGCGAERPAPVGAAASRPADDFPYEVGQKVIFPGARAEVWVDRERLERKARLVAAGRWDLADPEVDAITLARVGEIARGDLVEVVEIRGDHVGINLIRDSSNRARPLHGYVAKADFAAE